MPILKNKNYLPYALSNFFNNNERWQARALNSSQYHDLEQRVEQYKKELLELVPGERQTRAAAILNEIDEASALLYGILINEAAIEGIRAGLDLGELLYSGKSLETLLHENAFTAVKEREAS